jgi:hypothetical protein
MRNSLAISFAIAALFAFPATDAEADVIAGLVNTGAGLSTGQTDTNYSFTSLGGTATGTDGHGVVADPNAWPIGVWIANTANSQWLVPAAPATTSYDPSADGLYKWTLTFDLSGYDPNTASFTAQWAVDNGGYVKLNGNLLSGSMTAHHGLNQFTSFTAKSGFNSGINTLDFFVNNLPGDNNPTGLQVDFLSSNVNPVPEP